MMERAYGCQNMSPGVIINPRHIRPSLSKASSVVPHLFLGGKILGSHEDNWRKSQRRFGKLSHYPREPRTCNWERHEEGRICASLCHR